MKKCISPALIFSRNCKNSVLGCVLNLSPIVPVWGLSLLERLLFVPLSCSNLKHLDQFHILSEIFKLNMYFHSCSFRTQSKASFPCFLLDVIRAH